MKNLPSLRNLRIPTKAEIDQEYARRSLFSFTQYTKPDFIEGWFNRIIADELQQFYHNVKAGLQPRLMIFAPPRSGKSELFSRRFPAWAMGKDPDLQIISASYSADLSSKMNRDVQRIIDDQIYASVFPGTSLNLSNVATMAGRPLRNSDIFEIVGHAGAYRSAGVGGGITGMGADIGIIDDPVKDAKEANSPTYRSSVWDWYTTTFYTRLSPNSGILLGMTRWHEDDLAGRLIDAMENGEGDQWRIIRFPAIAEVEEAHRAIGEALHPERYPLKRLLRIRGAIGDYAWNGLYQQRPSAASGGIFKPGNIEIVDALPVGLQTVRGWDLAATKNAGDWTAGGRLGKAADGTFWIGDMVRERGGPDEVERLLVNTGKLDGVRVKQSIPQDPGQAGKSQTAYLGKKLAGISFEFSTESGDKATRAAPFAAQVNVGNVKMLKGPWNKPLIDEMRAFPTGSHDDQIDALSRAFNSFDDNLSRFRAMAS